MTTLVERRERWLGLSELADTLLMKSPAQAIADCKTALPFAALVMHHNFELDLEALLVMAENPPPFIGLLGPRRRRDDLFRLLPESARENLERHLHSPVGMDLGGRGPEAIALSIAAQLQSRLHDR
jgi:xanthine dehydrogenase accessory factor